VRRVRHSRRPAPASDIRHVTFRMPPDLVIYRAWVDAIADVDKRGDKTALLRLLRDGPEPSKRALHHLADLLDRHTLVRARGRPRTPSYTSTREQHMIALALNEARAFVEIEKAPVDAAIAQAAKYFGVNSDALESAYRGKHGGMRRVNRRRVRP